MIELALKAELPLIAIQTDDTLNVQEVLEHISGEKFSVLNEKDSGQMLAEGKYFLSWGFEGDLDTLYATLVEQEKVVVFVNLVDVESPLLHDAGMLPTPPRLVRKHLQMTHLPTEVIDSLMPTFGGLTLKEVAEVARLAMAHSGELTPKSIMTIRRMFMSRLRGIQQVDTSMPFYQPEAVLEDWAHENKPFFFAEEIDDRLIPRGLLLAGPPGTGKTQGAKYLANQFGIPLYLLEVGGMMGKYVGQSEGNMKMALQQIDRESPCVMLIDEVEKLFKSQDDSGVTARILSQLLWWLQEHKSRVLVVMTTNDQSALPEELYREGRIDDVMNFDGLVGEEAFKFASVLLDSFGLSVTAKVNVGLENEIHAAMENEDGGGHHLSQAKLTKVVTGFVKENISLD